MIVAEVVPGVSVPAVVFPNCPHCRSLIWPPLLPAGRLVLKALMLGGLGVSIT
jgi:hypothetical protein